MEIFEYKTGDALIDTLDWYGARNLIKYNFGTKKVNRKGDPIMHGCWVTTEDISVYTKKDTDIVHSVLNELYGLNTLKKADFKRYYSSINKDGRISSQGGYKDFNYNSNGKNPDEKYDIYWIKETQAYKVINKLMEVI